MQSLHGESLSPGVVLLGWSVDTDAGAGQKGLVVLEGVLIVGCHELRHALDEEATAVFVPESLNLLWCLAVDVCAVRELHCIELWNPCVCCCRNGDRCRRGGVTITIALATLVVRVKEATDDVVAGMTGSGRSGSRRLTRGRSGCACPCRRDCGLRLCGQCRREKASRYYQNEKH